jgi:hypothetical protein
LVFELEKTMINERDLRKAQAWYGIADAYRWRVARLAYKCSTRREKLALADAIGRGEDTVENLASAYALFVMLCKDGGCESVRKLRRRFPYTRWAVVYKMWYHHEFPMSEAREWLENFDGGNDAMAAEIENKYGVPEWERRANRLYREANKLMGDFGAPPALQRAAKFFVRVFDRVTKDAK